jgi:tetratricopeptide (TPR) repeat protein
MVTLANSWYNPSSVSRFAIFLLLLFVPRLALAAEPDLPRAAALFDAGNAAFERKDYRAAAQAYEEANRYAPRPGALYNAAVAWELAGQRGRAADTLLSIQGSFSGAEATEVKQRLAALEKQLATLTLKANGDATATIDSGQAIALPATVHLEPARHTIAITCKAQPGSHELVLDVARGERVAKEFCASVAVAPGPPAPVGAPVAPAPVKVETPSQQPIEADSSSSALPTIGLVAASVGGAALVGALVTGLTAQAYKKDADDAAARAGVAKTRDVYDREAALVGDASSSSQTFQTVTNVLLISGGVLVVGGIGLYLLAPRGTSKSAGIDVRVVGSGVVLSGTF